MECLDTGVDVDLFSKTVIPVVGDKHHGHPVISGVTRNLFRANAIYNIHRVFSPVAPFIGQTFGLPRATKNRYDLMGEKRRCDFSSAGLSLRFRPRSILSRNYNKLSKVMMHQGKPVLKDVDFDFSEIADSLNISVNKIDTSLPKQIVSTGLFTLPVCVKSYDILKNIKPDFDKVEQICKKIDSGSFFVFTFETLESKSAYHARCFCPLYGVKEDPVTGTANGAVSFYLFKNKIINDSSLVCEQGDIIGRPGRVFVEIKDDVVKVGGKALIVEERQIEL